MQPRPDVHADAAVGDESDEPDVLGVVVALARDEEAGDPELARGDGDVGAVEDDLDLARPWVVDARVLEETAVGIEYSASRRP